MWLKNVRAGRHIIRFVRYSRQVMSALYGQERSQLDISPTGGERGYMNGRKGSLTLHTKFFNIGLHVQRGRR